MIFDTEKRRSMETSKNEKFILQNLKDAGCDSEMITNFMADWQAGKKANGLKRLAAHRRALLDQIHSEQTCIDCLDYLIYQIQKLKNGQA